MRRVIGLFMIVWLLAFIGPVLAQDVTPVIPVEVAPSALAKVAELLFGVSPLAVIVFGIVEGLKPMIKNFIPQYEDDAQLNPTWYYPLVVRVVAALIGIGVASISLEQLRVIPYLQSLPDGWMIILGGILASVDSNTLHRVAEILMMIFTKFVPEQMLPEPATVQSQFVPTDPYGAHG